MTAASSMTRCAPLSALSDLPDEVLQHILFYVSPHDLVANVQRLSKRFDRLASEPLLWRHHCRANFTYWDSKHRIRQKFSGNVGDVDWKTLYLHRKRVASETAAILDSIIEGQVNRIQKFKLIADFGYDAKDTLLKHCRTSETAEDVLARRQALHHFHRTKV
jgi:F-box protein 21